jgi:anaerobic ribonucleoside-triphosphate reductase activating protein
MGGDNDIGTLFSLQKTARDKGLKTAWYSGRWKLPEDLSLFNYIKLGPYVKEYGGLDSKITNQKFYEVIKTTDKKGNILYSLLDKTYLFHK